MTVIASYFFEDQWLTPFMLLKNQYCIVLSSKFFRFIITPSSRTLLASTIDPTFSSWPVAVPPDCRPCRNPLAEPSPHPPAHRP